MAQIERGRLAGGELAPETGELVEHVIEHRGVTVEHIVSGRLEAPLAFDQEHDEWVAVLTGGAELDVDGDVFVLEAGDWLLLPRRVPHRLLRTEPGTRWLAVHFGAG